MANISLGIRLNNPLNIRYSYNNKWLGQTGSYFGFCEFESSDYGLRAAMLLLERYIVVYHLRFVRGIINRFAPSVENNTEAYIRFVQTSLDKDGYDSYSPIEPYSNNFYILIRSMALYESKFKVSVEYLRSLVNKFHLDC